MSKRYFKHITGFMDGTRYIMIDEEESKVWLGTRVGEIFDKYWHPNAVLNFVRTGQFREVPEKEIQRMI